MTKRGVVRAGVLAGVLLGAFAVVSIWIRPGPDRVDLAAVREGMTEWEVIEELGRPADEVEYNYKEWDEKTKWFVKTDKVSKLWRGDEGYWSILFDKNRVVLSPGYSRYFPADKAEMAKRSGLLNRLRAWLGW